MGLVAKDTNILSLAPENYQTVAQLTTEIMNISCVKSVGGQPKFLLGY